MFDGSTKTPLNQIECWTNSLHFGSFILHCVIDYFASFAFCTNTEQHNLTWLFACSLSLPFPTYYYSLVSHELCKMFSVLANLKSHFSDWYFSCMFVVKGDLLLPQNDKIMYFSAGTWRSHVKIVTMFVDQTWNLSKNLHDWKFQGKKFTQKTRNFRHLLNRDKKCVNALNWDKTSKKCS